MTKRLLILLLLALPACRAPASEPPRHHPALAVVPGLAERELEGAVFGVGGQVGGYKGKLRRVPTLRRVGAIVPQWGGRIADHRQARQRHSVAAVPDASID